jgi:hypothetical protein
MPALRRGIAQQQYSLTRRIVVAGIRKTLRAVGIRLRKVLMYKEMVTKQQGGKRSCAGPGHVGVLHSAD